MLIRVVVNLVDYVLCRRGSYGADDEWINLELWKGNDDEELLYITKNVIFHFLRKYLEGRSRTQRVYRPLLQTGTVI